jgi:hypothetical protein
MKRRRWTFRVETETDRVVRQAAATSQRTLTDFVVEAAVVKAERISPASWTPLETYPKRVRLKLGIGAASGLDDLVDFSFDLALAD